MDFWEEMQPNGLSLRHSLPGLQGFINPKLFFFRQSTWVTGIFPTLTSNSFNPQQGEAQSQQEAKQAAGGSGVEWEEA